MHCTQNPIYVFPEMKLRGLVPNSYIHVSLSYLYIPSLCSQIGRPILEIYKSLTVHECGKWETEHYNYVLKIMRPLKKYFYVAG
jgi:hypothetical protein